MSEAPKPQPPEWRAVVGYEGRYDVSSTGDVRSYVIWRGQPQRHPRMMTRTLIRGHFVVGLSLNGVKRSESVHRLVACAFIGPPPPGLEVCHNNGIGTDNRVSNLRWGTTQSNSEDAWRHGALVRGEARSQAKLTDAIVLDIRARAARGESKSAMAREFGVTPGTVSNIVHRRKWKHLGDGPLPVVTDEDGAILGINWQRIVEEELVTNE